jgi:hypothetical protein
MKREGRGIDTAIAMRILLPPAELASSSDRKNRQRHWLPDDGFAFTPRECRR